MAMTIQQYIKTREGASMIETPVVFALDGKMYQGFRGSVVEVDEVVLTDEEIDNVIEIEDGAMDVVKSVRRTRLQHADAMVKKEHRERRLADLEVEERELRVLEMRKNLGIDDVKLEDDLPSYECDEKGCNATFDSLQKLAGHKVGAHRNKKKE